MPSRTDAEAEAAPAAVENLNINPNPSNPGQGNLQQLTSDPRIRVLPGYRDDAASFEFLHEDHTVGNALRYIIMKNPEVEFCGYSIPHPAEPKMNLRIQTYEGTTVWDALAKGMDDLLDLCSAVEQKFVAAREDFMDGRMQE